MLRFAAFLIAWLIAGSAIAGMPPGMRNPQAFPVNASAGLPAVDDNLATGGYPIAGGVCAEWGHRVPCNNHYSTTRASTKYVSASDGIYVSVPSNVFGLGSGNGGLIEEARTNDALWSRDMTNTAWVKVTMTAALNAVGIDGSANSATTLTASSANATALETITLGSQSDTYSVFLKRVTGSGTINLCLAATACGTATPCTVTSTTTFTRCSVTATVLNPIVGIQIVTNGDAVIADFNQMEPGGFATSPILTTSATATRSFDDVSIIGYANMAPNANGSIILSMSSLASLAGRILDYRPGGIIPIGVASATSASTFAAGTNLTATAGTGSFSTVLKVGVSWSAAGRSLVAGNGTVATDTHSISPGSGSFALSESAVATNGYYQRITETLVRPPDTTTKALTQ